jgi:hypothetical protein
MSWNLSVWIAGQFGLSDLVAAGAAVVQAELRRAHAAQVDALEERLAAQAKQLLQVRAHMPYNQRHDGYAA